jgi:predicted nucleotidyltransferase component of viral defense system
MPSVTQLIRSIARNKKVQQYIIEKDYALSYLLAAIATTDGLRENLVLKGGTLLKSYIFLNIGFLRTWIIPLE